MIFKYLILADYTDISETLKSCQEEYVCRKKRKDVRSEILRSASEPEVSVRKRKKDTERKERKKKRKLVTSSPAAAKYVGACTLCARVKRAGSLCEAFDVTYHMTGCGGR